MIKCIIVEDETLAQQVMETYIAKTPQLLLKAVCSNAPQASEVLHNNDIDLIFLDIQLPGMTGLHFLRTLQNPPMVILTTAHADYALESYELNVTDYLLKPISYDRFQKAVQKLMEAKTTVATAAQPGEHMYVKSSGKFIRVNFADIVYVEGMKDYLKICTAANPIVTLQTMNEMEKLLPRNQFIRVHKSYIVSLKNIRAIYGNNIETDKQTIPIGGSYREGVMQLIGKNNA